MPCHETSAEDLILNPRNYLWFGGMKFVTLSQVKLLKKNRLVADRGKDLMDILLTEKIFSRREETLNRAVMEFLAYLHSSKSLNFYELINFLEPIFSQEGWRVGRSQAEEKNILVVCTHREENILKVNNFLGDVRKKNPLAKIFFLADSGAQNLISNLKYADKILTLDQSYSQDIMWQLCKIIELCRNFLWREHFYQCLIPSLEKNFTVSTLLAFLSGSCRRTGFLEKNIPIPEELKNFACFLTKISVT